MASYIHLNTYRDGRDVTPCEAEVAVDFDGKTYLLEVLLGHTADEAAADFFAAAEPMNGETYELVAVDHRPRQYRIEPA